MQFLKSDQMHPTAFRAGDAWPTNADRTVPMIPWPIEVKLPRLFSTYLGIGAKVCSPPAIDRRFKTIDFLVMLDIRSDGLKNTQASVMGI